MNESSLVYDLRGDDPTQKLSDYDLLTSVYNDDIHDYWRWIGYAGEQCKYAQQFYAEKDKLDTDEEGISLYAARQAAHAHRRILGSNAYCIWAPVRCPYCKKESYMKFTNRQHSFMQDILHLRCGCPNCGQSFYAADHATHDPENNHAREWRTTPREELECYKNRKKKSWIDIAFDNIFGGIGAVIVAGIYVSELLFSVALILLPFALIAMLIVYIIKQLA